MPAVTSALAADLALALDPAALARRAGIEPDDWQANVLRSPAPRQLLNCCRQSGKSTVTAALAIHTALYEPASLTLLLSPAERQSGELFKKCTALYRALGRPVPAESETALTLTLENGSRIVALPGKEGTARGYSGVRLLAIDEASRVPDELYYAVRPMLAVSGGRLVALSTPFGTRGWWYEAWRSDEAWARIEVPATDCPRISPAFLEAERQSMGAWWFDQEYGCRFLVAQDSVFRQVDIEAALSGEVRPPGSMPTATSSVPASWPPAGRRPTSRSCGRNSRASTYSRRSATPSSAFTRRCATGAHCRRALMKPETIPAPLTKAERRAAEEALEAGQQARLEPVRAARERLEADATYADRRRLGLPPTAAEEVAERQLSDAAAEALEQDETVPGGAYIVNGALVDAHGRRLD